jgi:hypothetical protein
MLVDAAEPNEGRRVEEIDEPRWEKLGAVDRIDVR